MTDTTLSSWTEVSKLRNWSVLLLGNGLSINVCKDFLYDSLYDEAVKHGLLEKPDRKVFKAFNTKNFELVLRGLSTAATAADAIGEDPDPYWERYDAVQEGLGNSVHQVHPPKFILPGDTLPTIKQVMVGYKAVFSTNYDLLTYWAMPAGGSWHPLVDCLWNGGFDPENCVPWEDDAVPVYFLHGAVHLAVTSDGQTWKRQGTDLKSLLDQFGDDIGNDTETRPLLITEGSANDKLRVIGSNAYLRHAFGQFRDDRRPLVVFGSALDETHDGHLLEAINRHEGRHVAISVFPGSEKENKHAMAVARAALPDCKLYFFDSTSHPLGNPAWQAQTAKQRAFHGV